MVLVIVLHRFTTPHFETLSLNVEALIFLFSLFSLVGCWVLSYRYTSEYLFQLPVVVFIIGSYLLLIDVDFYLSDHREWVVLQVIASCLAVLLCSLRVNLLVSLSHIIVPILFCLVFQHLEVVEVLSQQAVVFFVAPLGVYMSFFYETLKKKKIISENTTEVLRRSSNLGMWQWNLLTDEITYDQRWCEMLGYQLGELPSGMATWQNLVHPDDMEPTTRAFTDYLEAKTSKYEVKFRMRHRAGNWIVIISIGEIVYRSPDGVPEIFSGTHYDITKFQQLTEEKAELSQLTHAIQEMAKIGGWSYDIESGEVNWTDEVYHIHGLKLGTKIDLEKAISLYSQNDRPRISKCLEECMRLGRSYEEVFEFAKATGEKIHVRTRGDAFYNQEGKIYKVQGTFQEITEFVELQNELDLERAKLIHSSKLAILGEMAAGVAHEINNPLAIISGSSRLLQTKSSDPSAVVSSSEKIERASDRIARIVRGLRKFSSRSEDIKFGRYSLKAIVQEAIEMTRAKCQMASVDLIVEDFEEVEVLCDDVQVLQILINLISNAADANEGKSSAWIKVKVVPIDKKIEIFVQDSGQGVSDLVADKMFNPFFTTKAVGAGTGLGLSISKGIAREHGGDLEYRQVDGHTTMVFSLNVN